MRPWLAPLFVFSSVPLIAQGFGPASHQVAPELMRFLQLTPAQGIEINRLESAWTAELEAKQYRADEIRRNGGPSAAASLESLCHESTEAKETLRRKTRALLTQEQLRHLQLLDDALNLFPRVLEAQTAGLLPKAVATAPPGMPGGTVSVELVFTATPAKPLPGCLGAKTEVRPGIVPGR